MIVYLPDEQVGTGPPPVFECSDRRDILGALSVADAGRTVRSAYAESGMQILSRTESVRLKNLLDAAVEPLDYPVCLCAGHARRTMVDAARIAAPNSMNNAAVEGCPEMVSSACAQLRMAKKGRHWYFGMKPIGTGAESGLVHTVRGTAGNRNEVVGANSLLHRLETEAWGDAGYRGTPKWPDAKLGVRCNIGMRLGKGNQLDSDRPIDRLIDELNWVETSIRAKFEHPFGAI